jgi:hypothetical protein
MSTIKLHCFVGEVEVSIDDTFNWSGMSPGTYKVKRWGDCITYSPAGIGGTRTVWVEDDKGQEIEWCGDSVAHGIFLTRNPNYFNKK